MKKIFSLSIFLLFAFQCFSQSAHYDSERVIRSSYNLSVPPEPIDPQIVQDQDDMIWDDYVPIPGINWADPSLVPDRKFRMALVAVDFPDQPFVITCSQLTIGVTSFGPDRKRGTPDDIVALPAPVRKQAW